VLRVFIADGFRCLHNAHSPQREVEILQHQLLPRLNADDRPCGPRDIMVHGALTLMSMHPHSGGVLPYKRRVSNANISVYHFRIKGPAHHEPVLIALETLMSATGDTLWRRAKDHQPV